MKPVFSRFVYLGAGESKADLTFMSSSGNGRSLWISTQTGKSEEWELVSQDKGYVSIRKPNTQDYLSVYKSSSMGFLYLRLGSRIELWRVLSTIDGHTRS